MARALEANQPSVAEVMAINALRRWRSERIAIRHGKAARLFQMPGRPNPNGNTNRYDAAYVRVLAFERAFGTLDPEEQSLLLTHVDGYSAAQTGEQLGISARAIGYKLPSARRKLADVLDRLDLL